MNTNNYLNQKIRGIKRKYEYIISRGGCCEMCEYNKNLAALDFHHKDPNEKDFQIDARKFANCNLDSLKSELDKCMILCANCHREIHHPDLQLKELNNIIKKSNKKSFSSPKIYSKICPVCNNSFKSISGKIYCSKECREKDKKYPSKIEIQFQYNLLGSWKKVSEHFGISRKIISRIRKS